MDKLNIVAIPFHDWRKNQSEGFRTRDAHLLLEFSKHPSVGKLLIIDRPISLIERLVLRKSWKVKSKTELYTKKASCLSQVEENVFVLDINYADLLGPIIKKQGWFPETFARPKTIAAITESMQELSIREPVFYISSPLPIQLIERVNNPFLVFDAVDNLTKIPAYASLNLDLFGYYEKAKKIARIIFTNNPKTQKWLSEGRQPAHIIPNGVDPGHFIPVGKHIPADLANIRRPIVGYAGKMQEMFSIEIMDHVAKALPETSFVLIGQQLNPKWMRPLWDLPNVYYLGDKHYQSLPDYLANFDVCLVPYSEERQHDVDPIKFYEYLCMKKPVVTTNVGGVQKYIEFPNVKIASDPIQFTDAIAYFLAKISISEAIPAGDLPDSVTWRYKANQMISMINQEYSSDK
jgi:glycosyltransferase involved in cell wall biosynthesis